MLAHTDDDPALAVPEEHVPAYRDALRGRVVDLGAGGGSTLDPASSVRPSALAPRLLVEVDRRLERAEPAVHRVCAELDGGALPLASSAFDVVVCNHVLEHLAAPERLLAEIARIQRPGGFLVTAVPHGASFSDRLFRLYYRLFHRDPGAFEGHRQRFTRASFLGLLQHAGYTPLAVTEMGETYSWLHKHPVLQKVATGVTAGLRRVRNETFLYGWHVVARK